MVWRRLLLLLWAALAIAALALGVQSWRASRGATIVVEWSTASELDTAGFNLYRSQTESGPFTRVNPSLIPGSADPLTGGNYQFADHQVTPGVTYFYQLEEVETSGTIARHGPIQVQADAGGRMELVLAAALTLAAFLGLAWQALPRRSSP